MLAFVALYSRIPGLPTVSGWRKIWDDPNRKMEFAAPQLRLTFGEKLADESVVDAVAPKEGAPLELIHWKSLDNLLVAPLIECGSLIYQAPDLHPSVRQAVIFPTGATDYGTLAELFTKIFTAYRERAGLPETDRPSRRAGLSPHGSQDLYQLHSHCA